MLSFVAAMVPCTPVPRIIAIGLGWQSALAEVLVRLLDALAEAEPPTLITWPKECRDPGVVAHDRP